MKIAFPTEVNSGLESPVYNHFGSAGFFIIVDSETGEFESLVNQDLNHMHGKCQPLKALGGKDIEAVVVGGIGKGAMAGLQKKGARIYKAAEGSVRENLELFNTGKLNEFMPFNVCGGHGSDGDCGHH